jgi:hypothetical protein
MLKWLNENVPWATFVLLAIAGGAVAHIRVYEQAKIDLSFKQHFWSLTRRCTMAGFAGMLVYLAASGQNWSSSPWAFFIAGLCGLFSAEALDLMWRLVTAWMQGRVKISLGNGSTLSPSTTTDETQPGDASKGRRVYDSKE